MVYIPSAIWKQYVLSYDFVAGFTHGADGLKIDLQDE